MHYFNKELFDSLVETTNGVLSHITEFIKEVAATANMFINYWRQVIETRPYIIGNIALSVLQSIISIHFIYAADSNAYLNFECINVLILAATSSWRGRLRHSLGSVLQPLSQVGRHHLGKLRKRDPELAPDSKWTWATKWFSMSFGKRSI